MANPKLRDLISYVISELRDADIGFAKTKLMKLIYIIDVENYRRRGETVSGLEWRFYHYGPYAFEIDTALGELGIDIPQEQVTTQGGHQAIVFKSQDLFHGVGALIPSTEKLVARLVLGEWGMTELNPLLDYVYFHTEPMQDAKRGDLLDFAKIKRIISSSTKWPTADSILNASESLRAQFLAAKASRPRVPLSPMPRIDDVYTQGLADMAQADVVHVPQGPVGLDDQAKKDLSDQGRH